MRKICTRLYLFPQCAIYAQDLRKIVLLSPMGNICARFAQHCSYFSNAQYMCKICTRLYLFPQCAIYVQDLCKIVLLSPMCNICTRFAQDCTYLSNAQYMHKIGARLYLFPQCTRLYFFLQCAIYAQDLRIEEISTILCKSCTYIAHWTNKYNLVQILCIYCALEKEVQSCANLVHILRIEEISTILCESCAYIAHWRKKYNLAH